MIKGDLSNIKSYWKLVLICSLSCPAFKYYAGFETTTLKHFQLRKLKSIAWTETVITAKSLSGLLNSLKNTYQQLKSFKNKMFS